MPASGDIELVRRIAARDPAALGALFDARSALVHALAHSILLDEEAAESVLEETFWQLWCEAGDDLPLDGTLVGRLMQIARDRAITRRRVSR